MNAVRFKIKLEELEMLDWEQWGIDDHAFILKCAKDNRVEFIQRHSLTIFKGSYQAMYWFMLDVARRYDIEII